MINHHSLSRATHTIEMDQLDQINNALTELRPTLVTADEVGLTGATLMSGQASGGVLPGTAALVRVGWDGDPEFPFIHGRFSADGTPQRTWKVDVHTPALKLIAHRLGLHQLWGVGS